MGDDTVAVNDILIKELSLRSRPDAVFVGGLFRWRGAPAQLGADAPQPSSLAATYEPGVTADVHLSSLLSSAVAGLFQRDEVRSVQNLMVTIKDAPPGAPPADAFKTAKNVDFPTYIKAVDESRKPGSKANVLRITRPSEPPEFSVDAKGNVVAILHDVQIEVPAPESEAQGGVVGAAAKIYRIKIPEGEVALSYKVETAPGNPPQLHAKVEDFNPGAHRKSWPSPTTESRADSTFRRFSASTRAGSIRRTFAASAHQCLRSPGSITGNFSIRSVSPPRPQPSGWVRVEARPVPTRRRSRRRGPSEYATSQVAVARSATRAHLAGRGRTSGGPPIARSAGVLIPPPDRPASSTSFPGDRSCRDPADRQRSRSIVAGCPNWKSRTASTRTRLRYVPGLWPTQSNRDPTDVPTNVTKIDASDDGGLSTRLNSIALIGAPPAHNR